MEDTSNDIALKVTCNMAMKELICHDYFGPA